ncbi:hypothetical protein RFI_38808 [Reticulomyxa filosa]|uniref:Uncharacterized protein n=1 Tax=Reticulomyxa filosa TaxID=46433 RepID=X6LD47_RETFI|nr:hypothetical protein RFI_38808 [Reticulomyxa filosa]|eukprot:ETN98684.1 hypothetical protein RFI_38808 [Reticulomyxa filosa]
MFYEHTRCIRTIEFSAFSGGRYLCSGSYDKTIRIWDIEKTKQLIEFKGHDNTVISVKYGPNKSGNSGTSNTILSGSWDKSVRLWDIRSSRQIQVFNGHNSHLNVVEYSPFVLDNMEVHEISNVICSGSWDNTLRFWDIRSSKKESHVMKENNN